MEVPVPTGTEETTDALDEIMAEVGVTEDETEEATDAGVAVEEIDEITGVVVAEVDPTVLPPTAETQEHTARADEEAASPVRGPQLPTTQPMAAVLMAAKLEELHWQA